MSWGVRDTLDLHVVRQNRMSDPGDEQLIRITEIISDCMGAGGS